MTQTGRTHRSTKAGVREESATADRLDAQYSELLEVVFACERGWRLDDRITLAVRHRSGR